LQETFVKLSKRETMKRPIYLQDIKNQLRVHPVCAILGPRQVGKTTLARMFVEQSYAGKAYFFDLENPLDVARLENPMLALTNIDSKYDLIVIDEIQMSPDLFPVLRVLVDQPGNKCKFLILGSASRDLIRQSSETLAGRIGYIELPPFTLKEVRESEQLWVRGGFPRSYLAESIEDSVLWRQSYITTFLERDIPSLGFNIPAAQMRRFWLMLVNYHGQTFNASELSRSLGISEHLVRKYLDILSGTFMVRILLPWFENISKRQVKSPKIYFRDSGILHTLLGLSNKEELQTHAKLGAFWEGFALEQVVQIFQATSDEVYFWSTQADAELDLLIFKKNKRIGFEFKYTDSPRTTKSMHSALVDLRLDCLIVVYPGKEKFPLTEKIIAYGLDGLGSVDDVKDIIKGII
jgi:predicted AAA+ superfamily ATPase